MGGGRERAGSGRGGVHCRTGRGAGRGADDESRAPGKAEAAAAAGKVHMQCIPGPGGRSRAPSWNAGRSACNDFAFGFDRVSVPHTWLVEPLVPDRFLDATHYAYDK